MITIKRIAIVTMNSCSINSNNGYALDGDEGALGGAMSYI